MEFWDTEYGSVGNALTGSIIYYFYIYLFYSSGVHFKLLSIPEMGYLISDKPYPRGELLIKGFFFFVLIMIIIYLLT
jgi:hypothetical protein